MSQESWIPDNVFEEFQHEKENEKSGGVDFSIEWQGPGKGTTEKPNIAEFRFLPDPNWCFYKKFYYHMFQVEQNEKFNFFMCPKTFDFNNFCPICAVNSSLWTGTKEDQDEARKLKRKTKFIGNIFVVEDPQDENKDNDSKEAGKTKIYKFPQTVEQKLKEQIRDKKRGLGKAIFDPGESGFNFILKVASTTKDQQGNSYPEYSMSEFGRKPYALGNKNEIKEILNSTYDLNEHLQNMQSSDEKMYDALKKMNLYELISDKIQGNNERKQQESDDAKNEDKDETKSEEPSTHNEEPPSDTDNESSNDVVDDDNTSDEDLLAELDNIDENE